MTSVQKDLFALQDPAYRSFQTKLMPTVDPACVIGVRMPALRTYAKQFAGCAEAEAFLKALPHRYYEENNLHGILIESMQSFDEVVAALDVFLPYVNNWATCDLMRPRIFKNHREALLPKIRQWMRDTHPYTVRFGIEMLMVHFLEESFEPEYLAWPAELRSDEYYVKMMIAWFYATALTKQYDAALPILEQNKLDRWTHNKAISKAIESRCISKEQKKYIKTLKKKNL